MAKEKKVDLVDEEKEKEMDDSIKMQIRMEKSEQQAKPLLEKVRRAQRAVGDRASEHEELMAFYEGTQYNLSRYKTNRPWVVRMKTPYASSAIDTRTSSLIASDYRGELFPMAPEDEESVNALKDFLKDEWERMSLDNKIDEAIKASAIVRESYIHVVWVDEPYGHGSTKREGYIDTYLIEEPSSVYIDPSANCLKDARYVAILQRKSLDEVEEMYPDYVGYIKAQGAGFVPQDRGEVSFRRDYNTEQDDVCTIITMYEKINGDIRKSLIIENFLVEQENLEGLNGNIPIAQMRWKRAFSSPYGISLMDEIIDLQKATNAIESAITNTAVAYASPSYAVRKGSGLDPKKVAVTAGAPGAVYHVEGDIDRALAPIKVPSLDQAIIGVKNEYIASIDRIAGITNPYLGSVGTSGNTAQGTKMALERARIIEADVLHNIETFVEDLTHLIILYIAVNHSGDTVTTRNVDTTTNEIEFKVHELPENLAELPYTTYINLNTKTSYAKEREKEKILELYQMGHQYKDEIKLINQLDVLDAYELENHAKLVERFKLNTLQNNEAKAELIASILEMATSLGIPKEQVQPAIVELMSGGTETPITDQLMQMMQQMAQENAMRQEQELQQFTQNVGEAGVSPQAVQQMIGQMTGQGGQM